MTFGPFDLLVAKLPGSKFRSEFVPALKRLVQIGTIRIADLVFIVKDDDGSVWALKYGDLEVGGDGLLTPVSREMGRMLTEDDVVQLGQFLEPGSSAALMLYENVWAKRFRDAMLHVKGQELLKEHLPLNVVQDLSDLPAATLHATLSERVQCQDCTFSQLILSTEDSQ